MEHIEATPGVIGGKPRIKGTRIGVHDVKIWHLDQGMAIKEICAGYHLSPAQVHAALAYYFDHHDEIDKRLAEDEAYADEFFQGQPSLLERYGKESKA